MNKIRQKRQNLARSLRNQQRNKLFSNHRFENMQIDEDQTFIPIVYYLIENYQCLSQQIKKEDFQQFLDILASQISSQPQEDSQIRKQHVKELTNKYSTLLEILLKNIQYFDLQRKQNQKAFYFMRCLIRFKFVKEEFLKIFDNLLENTIVLIKNTFKNMNKVGQNQQDISYLIHNLKQFHLFFCEIKFIHSLTLQTQQQKTTQIEQINDKTKKQIILLQNKWVVQTIAFPFIYNQSFKNLKQLIKGKDFIIILKNISRQYLSSFIIDENKSILNNILMQSQKDLKRFEQKITEIINMVILLIYGQVITEQKQINLDKNQQISTNLPLVLHVIHSFIKNLQSKICQQKSNVKILTQVLYIFVNLFIEQPLSFIQNNSNKLIKNNELNSSNTFMRYFITSEYQQKSLMVKIIRQIQNLDFPDLIIMTQLLSIVCSYNDKAIQILMKIPSFQGYYSQQLNFSIILSKKLMNHISLDIRRMAYWLLINITGSQTNYHYGLQFIKLIYSQNILEQDYYSKNSSKDQKLIRQSIFQTLFNYLCNIKTFQEINQLKEFNVQGFKNSKQVKPTENQQQNLLRWILNNFGILIKSISQKYEQMVDNQKIFQILIYSLYNILSVSNQNKCQQSYIWNLFQINQIPKNIQYIYQHIPSIINSSNQSNTTLNMMEQLLDEMQKHKQLEI